MVSFYDYTERIILLHTNIMFQRNYIIGFIIFFRAVLPCNDNIFRRYFRVSSRVNLYK